MGKVLITRSKLDGLATTIAAKSGATLPLTIAQMDAAVEGISVVDVEALSVTSNGTYTAPSGTAYSPVTVAVPTPSPSLQSKTATPTESAQTITADSGYDGLSSVSVGAISSTYVGSGIDQRSSTDLTASGATVTVPAGYYAEQASKAVVSGTAGTPTATKGTVSNHSVSVTPSVTNSTGYITGGTKSGTAVTVSASELVSGNKSITANGAGIDVAQYASVDVAVPSAGSWELIKSQTLTGVTQTSTSSKDAGTIALGSAAATKDAIIWVHIRDTAGPRAGYFFGSDAIFVNALKANGSTSAFTGPGVEVIRYSTSSQYAGYGAAYGVYGYSIANDGTLTVRKRYNGSYSLTINGDYKVDVYKLTPPSGMELFPS